MLSTSAFNAFLKTLEEPPAHAIFILATTEKHKILPTILSRCQIFDFKRITQQDTVDHLIEIAEKEHISAEKAALQLIAQKSEGCMRDSLSILDKLVSFTGGQVTYQNTLEHLNVLDEDYYFRFHELLQKEDLSGVMLLFDEINKKGFEGELVLNGFASFYRNLLLSKDPATASILEVMEGMQDKFAKVAAQTETSFILSALNIVGEAEIQIRLARNKRLHVEMALIKLNFLNQAIELSTDQQTLVKKKRLDAPILLKQVPIVSFQPSNIKNTTEGGAQLVIQTPSSSSSPSTPPKPPPAKTTNPIAPAATYTPKTGDKKNLLSALREKYGNEYQIEEVAESQALTAEKLYECWNQYIAKLEKELKHSSAASFSTAKLQIENEVKFTVTVFSVTSQKFIDAEKMTLLDHLQHCFHNRSVNYEILVEAGEKEDIPAYLRMNTKQKFEYIANLYPMVKTLKDTLNLELD
jgi:DNA polymerase-3 subunit gamma/tau